MFTLANLRDVTSLTIGMEAATRQFETAQSAHYQSLGAERVITAWDRIAKMQDTLGEVFHSNEKPGSVMSAEHFLENV